MAPRCPIDRREVREGGVGLLDTQRTVQETKRLKQKPYLVKVDLRLDILRQSGLPLNGLHGDGKVISNLEFKNGHIYLLKLQLEWERGNSKTK